MTSFLIEHAQQNVWCNPGLDNQLILQPKKITPRTGGLNNFNMMGRYIDLPQSLKHYHVFQVGQIDPRYLGLFNRTPSWVVERWETLSEAVNTLNLEATVYTQNGVVLPRFKTYFMFTKDKALLFAVELDKRFPVAWYTDTFYFRFYTNAYLKMGAGNQEDLRMVTKGGEPSSTSTILYMQTEVATYREKPGTVRVYRNGMLVNDLTLATVEVGDCVEWVYDSSTKREVQFVAKDLHSFVSKLDNNSKYLLHHDSLDTESIDYQDDVDVYVLTPSNFRKQMGVYFNRNHPSFHRMVTHRDYSISTEVFTSLAKALVKVSEDPTADIQECRIHLYIREGGYNRKLIFDHSRIFELYKLPDTEVKHALIGLNATLPEWECSNLENNAYTQIMRSYYRDITIKLVEDAYGYNSISKLLADTPVKTVAYSGRPRASLPYLLQQNSTVYEFDHDGKMLGFRYHQDDNDYDASNIDCRLVEALPGKGSHEVDVKYGRYVLDLPSSFNYRVYISRLVNGIPNHQWTDISHLSGVEYKVENGKLHYLGSDPNHWLMVKTDKTFLAYNQELIHHEGLMSFSITEYTDQGSGIQEYPVEVPGAQLDIWLNGYALIKDLDYIVHFPMVHILNKRYLKYPLSTTPQQIHVRMTGFCDRELKLLKDEEHGWVAHGALSNNGRFDLRDDKILRIVVGGRTYHREDLKFFEDKVDIRVSDALNGSPYQIKSMVISLRDMVSVDSTEFMMKSIEVDKRVSDYLTSRMDTSGPPNNFAIPDKYPVVSPFYSHLIHLLSTGRMVIPQNKTLSDTEVIMLCRPYEGLLKWDPITDGNTPNLAFAYVIPHYYDTVQALKLYEYRFMLRVVKLYSGDLVDLSPFLNYTLD